MAATSTVASASTTPMRIEIQPKMRCFIAIPETTTRESCLPRKTGEANEMTVSPSRGKEKRRTVTSSGPGVADGLPDAERRRRHLDVAHAERPQRIHDRVHHRRRRTDRARFA